MKKVIYLGKAKDYNANLPPSIQDVARRIFLEIEVENQPIRGGITAPVLSITGVIGPTGNGDSYGSCGQILGELWPKGYMLPIRLEFTDLEPQKVLDLLRIWEDYHLNNMKVGCVHQRARGETWANNANAVCPECGHRLGHSWEYEPIPQDVLDFIGALPESSIPYPWRHI